eukprot:10251180-Heterocapsa_arctica.AAC.1
MPIMPKKWYWMVDPPQGTREQPSPLRRDAVREGVPAQKGTYTEGIIECPNSGAAGWDTGIRGQTLAR